MADKKITQLTSMTTQTASDLLLIIDDVQGTPVSKKITVKSFFGLVPANTVFNANTTVRGNKALFASNVVVTKATTVNTFIVPVSASTPSTNNATTETMSVGQMRFTNTFLYIAVNATTIKRVALSVF